MGPRCAAATGMVRVYRREHAMYDGFNSTRSQEWPHVLQAGLGNSGLKRHRACAQGRARDGQALTHDQGSIELSLDTTLHGDDDQTAIFGQALHFLGDITTRNHVQHHVNTTTIGQAQSLGLEVLGLVVDGMVGTQGQTGCAFLVATSGGDDFGTQSLGDLDGRDTNAAGSALHQQGFPALQSTAVKHIAPDSEECLGQRSRLHVS